MDRRRIGLQNSTSDNLDLELPRKWDSLLLPKAYVGLIHTDSLGGAGLVSEVLYELVVVHEASIP